MNTCNCYACKPASAPQLPIEKWSIGQRVKYVWHRDAGREPITRYGIIVDTPADWHKWPREDGVNVLDDDHPYMLGIGDLAGFNRWWSWDITGEIAIKHGGGNYSPLMEA